MPKITKRKGDRYTMKREFPSIPKRVPCPECGNEVLYFLTHHKSSFQFEVMVILETHDVVGRSLSHSESTAPVCAGSGKRVWIETEEGKKIKEEVEKQGRARRK